MENIDKTIIDLVNHKDFSRGLFEINEQFYYLRQEFHIRDLLLKGLNKAATGTTALADYPRSYVRSYTKTNETSSLNMGKRDIGLFEVSEGQFNIKEPVYSIEVKFHYPLDLFTQGLDELGDKKHHRTDLENIRSDWNRDICNNKTDCLILIICERDWLDDASVADSSNRHSPIDLLQEHASLRKQLASFITESDSDFNRALRTSIKSPTGIHAEAMTRYTFLVLFRKAVKTADDQE